MRVMAVVLVLAGALQVGNAQPVPTQPGITPEPSSGGLEKCQANDAVCVGRALVELLKVPPPPPPAQTVVALAASGQKDEKPFTNNCGGTIKLTVTGTEKTLGYMQCGAAAINCMVPLTKDTCTAGLAGVPAGPGKCGVAATAQAPASATCESSQ
jgi:hypothetical protein